MSLWKKLFDGNKTEPKPIPPTPIAPHTPAPLELEKKSLLQMDFLKDRAGILALIAAGADVNAKAANGATALMMAASLGDTDIVKALIAAGADVNAKVEGRTALWMAATFGYAPCVALLRAAGANE